MGTEITKNATTKIKIGQKAYDLMDIRLGVGKGQHSIVYNEGTANGNHAISEGYKSIANGTNSHAAGYQTTAASDNQFVIGKHNEEDKSSKYAFIVGNGYSGAKSNAHTLDWEGEAWFAGNVHTGEDKKKLATEEYVKNQITLGDYATQEYVGEEIGKIKIPSLNGYATEKYVNDKIEGLEIGDFDAGGFATKLYVDNSYPIAGKKANTTLGDKATAEGYEVEASGDYSHAEGLGTIAATAAQHAEGKYNIEDTNEQYAHIIGNGTSDVARSNAHTLDWHGNAWFAGKVTAGADPVENMDLVTLQYFNGVAGDIESALDSIITIQNSSIGGDGA